VDVISVLADMSLVLVVLEFMLLAAVPLAVLYLAVRGMHWLNGHLRPWLQQVQAGVNKVRDAVTRVLQALVKPFIIISVYTAQAEGLVRGVGRALGGKSQQS
jgi:hypothetical protein